MHVAMITGTSRGLGEALARHMHSRGVHCLCLARRFTEEQRSWEQAGRATLLPLSLDDLTLAIARGLAAAIPAGTTNLAFIANAATVQPISPAGAEGRDGLVTSLRGNIEGSILLAEAVIGEAIRRNITLSLVNISSGAAQRALPGWSIYCASKAAMDMYFNAVAADHPGLAVHRVDPGVIDTGMQADIRASDPAGFPLHETFGRLKREGGLQTPEAAAARVLSLSIGQNWPT